MEALRIISILCLLAFLVASCKKTTNGRANEPYTVTENLAGKIAGTYYCTLNYELKTIYTTGYEILIERIDNEHIRISGSDFAPIETAVMYHPNPEVNMLVSGLAENDTFTLYYNCTIAEITFAADDLSLTFVGTKK